MGEQRGSGDRLSIRDDISNTGVCIISERIQSSCATPNLSSRSLMVCVCVPYPFGSSATVSAQSCFLVYAIRCEIEQRLSTNHFEFWSSTHMEFHVHVHLKETDLEFTTASLLCHCRGKKLPQRSETVDLHVGKTLCQPAKWVFPKIMAPPNHPF